MLMKSEPTLRQAQKFAFKIFKKIEKEYYEIDLENAFTKTINNYLERFTKNKSE